MSGLRQNDAGELRAGRCGVSMILQEFVDALRRDVDAEAGTIVEPMLMGACGSFDEYRQHAGYLAGLRKAREILDALVKKANEGAYG